MAILSSKEGFKNFGIYQENFVSLGKIAITRPILKSLLLWLHKDAI